MAKIQISKAGTRAVSVEGAEVSFGEQMLAEVAATYDPKLHEAPLVIGHPTLDAPAFGWVRSLAFAEGNLVADSEPRAELVQKVRAGEVKKVSASFYTPRSANNPTPGKWYLRHVGFLGAVPPAVKGLDPVSFAEGDEVVSVEIEAGAASFGDLPGYFGSSVARLLGRLRDWMIDSVGLDKADQVIPKWEVDSLSEMAQRADLQEASASARSFGEQPSNDSPTVRQKGTSVTTATTTADLQAEKARADAAEAELKRLRDAETARLAAERRSACASFADALIGEARWPGGSKDILVAALEVLDTPGAGGAVVSFGEGDAARPLGQLLREQLQQLPPSVSFGEHARGGADRAAQDPVAVGRKAAELIASKSSQGITLTAAEAVAQVQQGA